MPGIMYSVTAIQNEIKQKAFVGEGISMPCDPGPALLSSAQQMTFHSSALEEQGFYLGRGRLDCSPSVCEAEAGELLQI